MTLDALVILILALFSVCAFIVAVMGVLCVVIFVKWVARLLIKNAEEE